MSIIVNGIRYSYDYDEYLEELIEDLSYGNINLSSKIYIKRDKNVDDVFRYKPIIKISYRKINSTKKYKLKNIMKEMIRLNEVL